jgi:hypothetical protein
MRRPAARPRATRRWADLWAVLLAVLVLSPLWRAGYPLGRDMVFTPRQPLTADSIGLGTAAPRAVPLDAVVALLSHLADGAVLGRLLLLAPLVLAGCGAWRLVPAQADGDRASAAMAGALAAAGFAVWNPFVVERLALGQWALLWCYGTLPWLVLSARRAAAASAPGRGWPGVVVALAACSITPTGGLIGAAVLVAVLVGEPAATARRRLAALLIAALLQLPWLVPAVTASAGLTSDPGAVAAFASRAERPGGVLLSLLGLGGIWDAGSTPASRAGWLGYLTTVVVLAVLVIGLPVLWRSRTSRWAAGYTVVAACGALLASVTVVAGGAALLRAVIRTVPGAGLLRDGQKWLLPLALLCAVCLGTALQRVGSVRGVGGRGTAAERIITVFGVVLGGALPLLVLPDAIGAVRPTLTPAHYPPGWYRAAAAVDGSRAPGAVLSLPFASYRSFDWLAASSVIDPLPRWLDRDVIVQDRLVVDGRLLRGEDPRAASIAVLLTRESAAPDELATALARAGVGWVWIEDGTPGPSLPDVSALVPVLHGGGVQLYRVPGSIASTAQSTGRRIAVIVADGFALVTLGSAFGALAVQRARRCYTRR